jgi:hypothetical protein
MTDPTKGIFDQLAHRGHVPLLRNVSGTLRFDLIDGHRTEHWYVTVKKGNVTVSRGRKHADCLLRTDKPLFVRIMSGKVNAMTAVLRGDVAVEGQYGLLLEFQRLLPGPPGPGSRRDAAIAERGAR